MQEMFHLLNKQIENSYFLNLKQLYFRLLVKNLGLKMMGFEREKRNIVAIKDMLLILPLIMMTRPLELFIASRTSLETGKPIHLEAKALPPVSWPLELWPTC